jgi:integrase/recombinase XerD
MTSLLTARTTVSTGEAAWAPSEAQLAAAAFLARYSGRTLEAYRFDLRCFFQWATDHDIDVLAATRVHIELYRSGMERRGLAASTIDRRLSTVCGYFRFAHIDGRIAANRPVRAAAQSATRRTSRHGPRRAGPHPVHRRALRRRPRSTHCAPRSQRTPCHRSVRHQRRGPRLRTRTPYAANHRQGQQARHDPARAAHGAHRRPRDRGTPPGSDPGATGRTTPRSAHCASVVRSIGKRAGLGDVHPHMRRAAFIMAAPDAGVPLRDVQLAARHADPRTTTIYDHRRQNFDRHAAYVVVAFVASG